MMRLIIILFIAMATATMVNAETPLELKIKNALARASVNVDVQAILNKAKKSIDDAKIINQATAPAPRFIQLQSC
jgi:hypothetical protein